MNDTAKKKKKAMTNAEKQKRYRERQKERGKQEMRGYLSPEAKVCYHLISEKTTGSDSILLSNAFLLYPSDAPYERSGVVLRCHVTI